MEVYALYGPSGTGKSSSALNLAHEYGIPAIIDDGILIYRGRKVAGYSAKYEKTQMQAVKRAIFHDENHAKEVMLALRKYPINKLLILGTSQKMVDRIADALGLPPVTHYIPITEIKSSSEIKAAQYTRQTKASHAIPIPKYQVEKDWLGKWIARFDEIFSKDKVKIGERTIVQPQFMSGQVHVHERVLEKIVIFSCKDLGFIESFPKISVTLSDIPKVDLTVTLIVNRKNNLHQLAETIRRAVYFGFITHLNVEMETVNIYISKIVWKQTS